MRDLVDWILEEEQKNLFEFLVAVCLTLLFLALAALLLWPAERLELVAGLGKGYGFLWAVLWGTAALAGLLQRLLRMNLYDRSNAYVITGLILGGALQVGWSAFAARMVHGSLAGTGFWAAAALHVVGALSCVAALFVISTIFQGAIYRLVNLPLALVSFLVFSIWPGLVIGAAGAVVVGLTAAR